MDRTDCTRFFRKLIRMLARGYSRGVLKCIVLGDNVYETRSFDAQHQPKGKDYRVQGKKIMMKAQGSKMAVKTHSRKYTRGH